MLNSDTERILMGFLDAFRGQYPKGLSPFSIRRSSSSVLNEKREECRIANMMTDDPYLQLKMNQIDTELGRRMPNPTVENLTPRRTEHGWYLPEDD